MKNKMLKSIISYLIIAGFLTGCLLNPDDNNDDEAKGIPLQYLCVSDSDIEGCNVNEDILCEIRDKERLEESIGASAARYIDYGVEEYIYQEMRWEEDQAQVYVMDFTNKENSKDIYEYWREEIAPYDTIDGFTRDAVFFDAESGLYTFYSRKDRFYIEVFVFGQSSKDIVSSEIADLIEFYLASIQEYMESL